ncbi:thioesterase family protein [Leifsonia kafniensis]|uniref:Thioesterase family protein n=1 Tax=Leifsonia kafniensis TaxID=475957 RepID=A0ABP7JZN7_9MICO
MAALAVEVALRWGDLDAYGHINNVAVLRILEEARSRGFWDNEAIPLPPLRPEESTWSLVAEVSARYRRPLDYSSEPVEVRMTVSRVRGASFTIHYSVFAPAVEGVHVEAETVIVLIDAQSGAPTRLSPELRAALGTVNDR